MRTLRNIILLLTLALTSCFKEPGNYPPEISDIVLIPSVELTPGSDIELSAVVSDPDGDDLQFYWEANSGMVKDPFSPVTTWELSMEAEPLSFKRISLTVTDGRASVTRSRTIQVAEGLLLEGYTYFSGTTIPVPGVKVTIGKFTGYSDDNGYFVFPHLKEGTAMLQASKEGFDESSTGVYLQNARSSILIEMSSGTRSRQIGGQIRTVDHLTFGGLKVSLLNPDFTESELHGFTDAGGQFVIPSVPLGTRYLMVSNRSPDTHFLNDTLIYRIEPDLNTGTFDARIKIRRTVLSDRFASQSERWEPEGAVSDGFYLLGKGQQMTLREFIRVPEDAEKAMVSLQSFVVGGCDMVGRVPSHRLWVLNSGGAYMGGVSWGGEGNNFSAELEWFPSESPNFMDIYGRDIKLRLEIFGENPCVPLPQWRIYQVEFSYFY